MAVVWITVYCLYGLIWLMQNFQCRAGFCGPRKPVVKICTENTSFMRTSANIDTVEAPKLQQNYCKCTLSPTRSEVNFHFIFYRRPSANMEFAIKDVVLDKDAGSRMKIKGDADLLFTSTEYALDGACLIILSRDYATDMNLMGDADLLFTTIESATDGACLIVSTEDGVSKFNITCNTRTTKVTTGPSTSALTKDVTILSTSTEILTDSTTQQHVETEDNGTDNGFITIILLTVIGALILVVGALILFIVLKRYRLTKEAERNDLGGNHEVSAARQTEGQGGQMQPGDFINEGVRVDAHALPYESLNMYVNNPLAGETYQQLDSGNTNGNEQSIETTSIQPKKQSKDNINEGLLVDTPSQPYESLNMYVNDTLAGETYQQLDSHRS